MQKSKKAIRLINFPSLLTGNVTYDYTNVGIDYVRDAVVENAVRFFGREGYDVLKNDFQTVVANRHAQRMPTTFADYQDWMFEAEVWGVGQLVPLAIEWGLDPYIEDWEEHLNGWLDLYPTRQEAA